MKTNKLDNFESFVNDTLSGEEVAYNPSDWNDLSSRLNNIAPKPFYKKSWFLGGAAAIVLGVSSFAYYNNNDIEVENTLVSETKETPLPTATIEEVITVQKENITAVIEETAKEEIKNIKPTSSETKGKEEVVNESTTNHSKPQSSLPTSSTTVSNEEKDESNKKEIEVAIPVASYEAKSNLSGCKGLVVALSAEQQDNVKYLWSFGDGEFSSEINPTHQYNVSGTYKIELIVQSTLDDRILTKSDQESNVTVFQDPNLDIITNKTLDKGLTTVNYTYVGDDLTNIFWNLGNGVSSDRKEVTTTYKKRGNYKVLLEATSLQGCKSITEENIFIEEDYNLLAPNAFTPDGDGLNDNFIPEALKVMDCNFTMVIRSRTEGIVFESTNLDRPWDGKSQKTSLDCPEDNYIWIVNLTNSKGQKEQYTGTILIKR